MRTFESEQNHKIQLEITLGIILIRWLRPILLLTTSENFSFQNLTIVTALSAILFSYYKKIYNKFGLSFLRMIEKKIKKIDPGYEKLSKFQLDLLKQESFNRYASLSLEQANFVLATLEKKLTIDDFNKFKIEQNRHLRHVVAPDQVQYIAEDVKQQMINFLMSLNSQLKCTKLWDTLKDKRVRPAHRLAQNQIKNFDQFYLVDDETLMYPRDPRGSLSNIINCRCSSRFSFKKLD